jgi:two-component system, cell cycle sensor histidine kinase and response regulator CckA
MLSRLASDDVILTTRLDPSLALVRADPGQVQQVLMNLVVNARDAMPDGGTITIETHPAELDESFGVGAGADLGRYVALVVADTGTGMPPDIRDQIFEPFFTTKEPGKGTGLGLSTVQGIVEQSGGRIFVYSEPDQGTTFKIYLPSADAVATKNPAPAPAPRTPNSAASESILLVEDDAAVRKVTSSIRSKAGYSVVEAINGAAGLAACADRAVSIDLVLTDMVMPQIGGRELATGVRRERPGTPIVFMSGYARTSIGDEELVANERFVEKPFTAEALLRAVREMLDRAPAARSA